MFGTNPVRHATHGTDGKRLMVQDVFYTIQGEGPFAGQPAVFVRLWGCNLRCKFCDTDFESNPAELPLADLVARVWAAEPDELCRLAVITGGEPMRQNILPLVKELEADGWTVQIETAGTLWVPGLEDTEAKIVCSPKTVQVHPMIAKHCTHFKYIIKAGQVDEQGYPNTNPQTGAPMYIWRSPDPTVTTYVQPMDEGVSTLNAVNVATVGRLAMKHGFYVSLQMHKLLGVD